MALLVPNTSEIDGLNYFLNKASAEDLVLRLYVNNVTPSETDVTSNYSEASGGGYAAVTLIPANWAVTSGAPSQAQYPAQTFTFTGAIGNVYGYYVTRSPSGRLAWAELFAGGPFPIASAGDQITVTPLLTLD